MVIWRNVIKRIFAASLPTIVLPAILVGIIIYHFGFTLDSLVAVLFFGELYIIWAQLEVALRQTRLLVIEYEPELKIEMEERHIARETPEKIVELYLGNAGDHIARNVLVSLKTSGDQERFKYSQFTNIAPNEKVYLGMFSENALRKNTITVDIIYENVLGELSGAYFVKKPQFAEFIAIKAAKKLPGLLLNSLEELISSLNLLVLSRKMTKLGKVKGLKLS